MKSPILLILSIASLLLLLGWFNEPSISQASPQTTPTLRPTATNVGGSSSNSGSNDKDDAPAPISAGGLHGYVYDFSAGGSAAPGIAVVLDGGGWQAETVTDSNGYYQFTGLGSSAATLNLRLPAGAHALMPDWPVHTAGPVNNNTNVGFYWGNAPILPVQMAVTPENLQVSADQAFSFQVTALNQSGNPASNVFVEARFPASLVILQATATHGQVSFSDHYISGRIDTLNQDETGVLTISARFAQNAAPQTEQPRITLTYAEQLTPQVLEPNFSAIAPQNQITTQSPPVSTTDTKTANDKASSNPVPLPSDTTINEQPTSLIPTTGDFETANHHHKPILALSLLSIIWMSFAGIRSCLQGDMRH